MPIWRGRRSTLGYPSFASRSSRLMPPGQDRRLCGRPWPTESRPASERVAEETDQDVGLGAALLADGRAGDEGDRREVNLRSEPRRSCRPSASPPSQKCASSRANPQYSLLPPAAATASASPLLPTAVQLAPGVARGKEQHRILVVIESRRSIPVPRAWSCPTSCLKARRRGGPPQGRRPDPPHHRPDPDGGCGNHRASSRARAQCPPSAISCDVR